MADDKLDDFKDDFSMLLESGFIAVKQLDEVAAKRIFEAAQVLNPDSSAPKIGMGYIALNKLEVKEAAKIFEEVVEKEPDNHLAQTFLGICYLLTKTKRKKGEKLVQDAIKKSIDPTILSLANIALEWANNDLKKEKAPFFPAAEEQEELEEQKQKK
jgi:tetratricopeptide (TPR) repeat protein